MMMAMTVLVHEKGRLKAPNKLKVLGIQGIKRYIYFQAIYEAKDGKT